MFILWCPNEATLPYTKVYRRFSDRTGNQQKADPNNHTHKTREETSSSGEEAIGSGFPVNVRLVRAPGTWLISIYPGRRRLLVGPCLFPGIYIWKLLVALLYNIGNCVSRSRQVHPTGDAEQQSPQKGFSEENRSIWYHVCAKARINHRKQMKH